ncbi:TatD family hydrolase [Flavobacteriales bacterium]|nr:TatD family hydrolase [Flavobacteriales bacterium]
MILTDTHTHLYANQFDEDREQVIQNCFDDGISRLFLPNIDKSSVDGMMKLVEQYPENCFPMIGIHPCSVNENWKQELDEYKELLKKKKFYAIGEIGIDLYWDKTTQGIQEEAFEAQIILAKELKLPIVIHARDSFDEIFAIVDKHNDENLTGIFHCFNGTIEQANKIINYGGFKLGIGGVVTFKNAGVDKVVKQIPLEHLVLETDSPYLAPHPNRGKRNESTYLTLIAQKVADLHEVSLEEIANVTTSNSKEVFGI